MNNPNVTIPKEFQNTRDLVAIPRQDYQEFLQIKAETEDALRKVREGEKAHKQGKTRLISSVAELM